MFVFFKMYSPSLTLVMHSQQHHSKRRFRKTLSSANTGIGTGQPLATIGEYEKLQFGGPPSISPAINTRENFAFTFLRYCCRFLTMWTIFSTLICCFISLYAYGNLADQDTKHPSLPQPFNVSENATTVVNPSVKLPPLQDEKKDPIVVEVSDSQVPLDEDEENAPSPEDENHIIKPSIAPATPLLAPTPSSVIMHEYQPPGPEASRSSLVEAAISSMVVHQQPHPVAEQPPSKLDVTSEVAKDASGPVSVDKEEKQSGAPGFPSNEGVKDEQLVDLSLKIVEPIPTDSPLTPQSKEQTEEVPPTPNPPPTQTTPTPITLGTEAVEQNGVDAVDLPKEADNLMKSLENEKENRETSDKPVVKERRDAEIESNVPVVKTQQNTKIEDDSLTKTVNEDKQSKEPVTEHQPDKVTETDQMLSFTEWKQKLDREKEIKEKEDVVEIVVEGSETNETIVVPKPKRKKKLSDKNKKNYASPDCGAKVVSANSNAQHSSAILKEDKDAYMLNPCNVQAWVVVELCERIQLDSIDFANFEMFSSSPETFTLHVSNRFPTREWELVQEFETKASSSRQVQNFPIKDKFYAKYIKFEVLKYVGKEHYCPLSLLRVYGITEVEEYEQEDRNDEDADSPPEEESPTETTQKSAEDQGLFASAKNAVVGLVNNVAEKFSSGKSGENGTMPGVVPSDNRSKIVTLVANSDNMLEYFEDVNFISTCIQRTLYSEYNTSVNPICGFGMTYVFMKQMCPTLKLYRSLKSKKETSTRAIEKPKATSLNSGGPPPIPRPPLKKVVIVETDQNTKLEKELLETESNVKHAGSEETTVKDVVKVLPNQDDVTEKKELSEEKLPVVVSKSKVTAHDVATTKSSISTCSKLKSEEHPIDVTNLVVPQPSFTEPSITIGQDNGKPTAALKVLDKMTNVPPSPTHTDKQLVGEIKESSTTSISTTSSATVKEESVDVLEFKVDNKTDVTTSMVAEKVENEISNTGDSKDTHNQEKVLDKATKDIEYAESKSTSGDSQNKPTSTDETETPLKNSESEAAETSVHQPREEESTSVNQIPITEKDKQVETNQDDHSNEKVKSESSKLETQKVMNIELQNPAKSESQNAVKSETPTETKSDPQSDKATKPEVSSEKIQASKSTKALQSQSAVTNGNLAGSKESIIVKLNAKIKGLQQNLTMSMMYLEEMSQKYRTAVAAVDKRHEKKSFALNVSLKAQQDLIQYQSKVIIDLTNKIEKLTSKLENITETMHKQHEMITENHVFWVFIEVVFITLFMIMCRTPNKTPSQHPIQQQSQVQQNDVKTTPSSRRKSEPVVSHVNGANTGLGNQRHKKTKRSHSAAENLYANSTTTNTNASASICNHKQHQKSSLKFTTAASNYPDEIEPEASRRKRRKKLVHQFSTPNSGGSGDTETPDSPKPVVKTRLSNTAGLLFYAGKGFLSGLTGAFYSRPSTTSKPSRRADALIDQPTVRSKQEQKATMKRAKSIDLPTVIEEVASINDLQMTPQDPAAPPQNRPKSVDSVLQNVGKKHRNIKHAKAVGRFS
eukprot:TCONS_00035824-protein